jgi:hypothetical protein
MVTISETSTTHQISKTDWKNLKEVGKKAKTMGKKCMQRHKNTHQTTETTLRYGDARSQWKMDSR